MEKRKHISTTILGEMVTDRYATSHKVTESFGPVILQDDVTK